MDRSSPGSAAESSGCAAPFGRPRTDPSRGFAAVTGELFRTPGFNVATLAVTRANNATIPTLQLKDLKIGFPFIEVPYSRLERLWRA